MNNKIHKVNSQATAPKQARATYGPATAGFEWDADTDTLVATPDTLVPRVLSPYQALSAQSVAGVGNGADTTDDTLLSVVIPAKALKSNGKSITLESWGAFGATGNNKTVKLKFGSATILTTGVVTTNGGGWYLFGNIVRTGVATQQCYVQFQTATTLSVATFTAATQDETTALTIAVTGASPTTGAASDVVGKALLVSLQN